MRLLFYCFIFGIYSTFAWTEVSQEIPKEAPKEISKEVSKETLKDYQPIALYLTWQKDPTSTMTIQWISKSNETDDVVEYLAQNTSKDEQKPEVTWNSITGSHHKVPKEMPYIVHVTELQDLTPNTVYTFRLGSSTTQYRFRTMPKELSEPITFLVGGDTHQGDLKLYEETCKQAALQEPHFVLFGGDLAYSDPGRRSLKEECSRWITWLKTWTSIMKTQDGTLIPLIVVIGNHEVKGGYNQTPEDALFFYSLFAMPGPQGYNMLRFGNYLSLALLDSGHTHPIGGEQTAWLAKELSSQRHILHRFAVYHVPAFPSVRSYRQSYSASIRRHWVPLFEKHGVQFVFENHDHAYKRTYPLIDGSVDPSGVVYIGDGSWGVKPRVPKKAKNTTYLAKTVSARQFIKLQISKKAREFWSITSQGEIIDHYIQNLVAPRPITLDTPSQEAQPSELATRNS